MVVRPAISVKSVGLVDGAQDSAIPTELCTQATTSRPSRGGGLAGTMTTPEISTFWPFSATERYRMRQAVAPAGAPFIGVCEINEPAPGRPLLDGRLSLAVAGRDASSKPVTIQKSASKSRAPMVLSNAMCPPMRMITRRYAADRPARQSRSCRTIASMVSAPLPRSPRPSYVAGTPARDPMKTAAIVLTALLLTGCAASRREAADPDAPKRVCESTTIGSQPKTFCY